MYQNRFFEENKFDIYSQNGEDGVVRAMLAKLNITTGWVCEFGAWNGIYLSNTFALVERGFKAVYIEGDQNKFKDLLTTCHTFPNITPILCNVDHNADSKHSIDNILARTDIPSDFALLSIDIDSFDYQVWQSMVKYKPRIVIIEINSAVQPSQPNYIHGNAPHMQGTGFFPTLALAEKKGYKLLAHTGNMVFVRNEDCDAFDIPSDPFSCFRTSWLPK